MSNLSDLKAENERLTSLLETSRALHNECMKTTVELSTRLNRIRTAQEINRNRMIEANNALKDSAALPEKEQAFLAAYLVATSEFETLLDKALNTDDDLMAFTILEQNASSDTRLH